MTGNLEVKRVLCSHGGGITVTSKWNTDNILNTTLDVEVCLLDIHCIMMKMAKCLEPAFQDHVLKGLKISLESTFAPDTGAKNGLLKAEMKTNPATLTIDTVCIGIKVDR